MRPTRLRLRNFGCFRGEHEVDFAGAGSDLFAIAGPTGSGKSTLLDAMTWALYGATPRLGARPNEHILTPGETDLSVVLEFAAGGQEYRASRGLKRRTSSTSADAKLERLAEDGTWRSIGETDRIGAYEAKLREIVGLDYDGYVRAVTLPQNAFDEFLRGDDKKRREVIKALLKAHTIEKIRELAVREKDELGAARDQARARIAKEYEGVTPERERELAARLEDLESELARAREALEASRARLHELERLGAADADRRAALEELAELEAASAAVAEARDALERARAAEALVPAVKAYRGREKDLAEATRALAASRVAAERAVAERDGARAEHEEAAAARAENEPLVRRRLEEAGRARRDAELLARHRGGPDLAPEADDEPFDEGRLAELAELSARVGELRQLERQAAAAAAALEGKRAELAQRREKLTRLEAETRDIVARGKELSAAAKAAKERYEEARIEHAALDLRQHLHAGGTCPVCHGTVTAVPASDAGVDLEALRRAAEAAQRAVDDQRDRYTATDARAKAERQAVADLERAVLDHHQPDAESAQTELRRALAGYAGYGATAAEVAGALQGGVRAQLARLARRLAAVTGGRDVAELVRELEAELGRLDAAVEGAQQRLTRAEAGLAAASATLAAAEEKERSCRERLAEAESDLEEALARSRFATLEAAESAILDAAAVERLRERVEGHERRRGEAAAKRAAAEGALAGRAYDPEEHRAVGEQARLDEERVAEASRGIGQTQQQLDDLRKRLAQLRALNDDVRGYEERLAVLANLDLWLRSDRFEAYVLGHALADLAANASVIIHELTEGRYELTYEDEFHVRDTWMDSHRRSVKTLSGGESFIVSLALALALAGTVAGRQSLGALFLDEGFGTLDAESLDSVTEVLSNLTSSGRMVGVITHVTSLTERLPARLVVTKGQQGSRLAWDS